MENQPEIIQAAAIPDEMEKEDKAAAAIPVEKALVPTRPATSTPEETETGKGKSKSAILSLRLMENQSEIIRDEMEKEDKAAAAIPEEKALVPTLPAASTPDETETAIDKSKAAILSVRLMENQPERTQDETKKEDKAAAAIPEEKAVVPTRPATSTPGIPSSSHDLRSLVDIFGLGPFSDSNLESISSIHNRALEKLSTMAIGEYPSMSDRSDAFHGVRTQYKYLGRWSDLVVVNLSELLIGETNEFIVICGELCVDPFRVGRIYTVMKEANTEVKTALSIVGPDFMSSDQSYAKRAYPKGTKIALKQPRLVKATDGFYWLDVDNPRSIVRIQKFPENNIKKLNDWFERGERAFDSEDWDACVRNYTKCELCISQMESEDMHKKLMRCRFHLYAERSRAYIELARYYDALDDAETCCSIAGGLRDSQQMIIQRMKVQIESLISLGRYKAAYWCLVDILPSLSTASRKSLLKFSRKKCIEYYRLGEAIAGIAKNPNDCKTDADYIGPVEIKNSAIGEGRGLYTTKFAKAGTVLLLSRALARCDDYSCQLNDAPTANDLVRNVEKAITHVRDEVLKLFLSFDASSGNSFKEFSPEFPEFDLNFDESPSTTPSNMRIRPQYDNLGPEGILRILRTIAFDDMCPENMNNWMNPAANRSYYGIWLLPSLINHSCLPNASRINVGDVMSIHATKDIKEGEEITIPYFNVLFPYRVRQAACRMWGFSCTCERCQLEGGLVSVDGPKGMYEKFVSAYLAAGLPKSNAKLSDELDGWLESPGRMLRKRGIMLIRSSFILLYLARICLNLEECDQRKYEEESYRKYMYNLKVARETLVATCPGHIGRLLLDCRNMATYRQNASVHREYEGFYRRIFQLKESCDSVYGCQKQKIMKAILRKLSNSSLL